jgi:magnesium chelatase family protein
MLARRLATILPVMSLAKALEATRTHSIAGLTGGRTAVVTTRPFRAPHHTISAVGLIGGGQRPLPGEVSLAHHGILLLDERCECKRHVLEGLRQSLGTDLVTIARALLANGAESCSPVIFSRPDADFGAGKHDGQAVRWNEKLCHSR